jgi:large subunit ribosomal protein L1
VKKHGKQYQDAQKLISSERIYDLKEAVDTLKGISTAKFDETVELHLRTNVNAKHTDQMVRGVAQLPHGLGKEIRVLVFADGEAATIARDAGADYIADSDIMKQIEGGWTDFEVGLAVPDMMSKIGKLGRVLGRKGLMPNPRTGTMVQQQDLPKAISDAKMGRVEYKTDRTSLIHCPVGKKSFSPEHLADNVASLMNAVVKSKPTGIKGTFIRAAYLTSTMGPSIPLDVKELTSMKID